MSGSEQFGRGIRHGAVWSYAVQAFVTVLQFVVGVIMARLLGPEDFGVFIAVTAFTAILMLLAQFGIPQALLQANTITDEQKSAGFWLILLLALVFTLVAAIVAEPLGRVYQSGQFAPLMYVMCTVFFLSAHATVGQSLLRREMRFAEAARISASAQVLSAVICIGAALLGLGVYSLALGAIVGMLGVSVGVMRSLSWRPGAPQLGAVRPLLRYAAFTTLNNVQETAINRSDNMIVGAVLGTGALGLYNRAYSLARLPSEQFSDSLRPLLLGALSRIQGDALASRQLFLKAVAAIATVTLPFLAVLLVAGPALVRLIYGDAWAGAGPPLQVMVFGGYFVMLSGLQLRLAYAQGLVKDAARVHFLVLVTTVLLALGAAPFGLLALAVAITLREVLWAGLLARLLHRAAIALPLTDALHATLPALIATGLGTLAAVAVVDFGAHTDPGGLLLECVELGVVLFLTYGLAILAMARFWPGHAPLASTVGLLTPLLERLRRRAPAR